MYCSLMALFIKLSISTCGAKFERRPARAAAQDQRKGTDLYSSWPAVSSTSRRATSSSIVHCFLYESVGPRPAESAQATQLGDHPCRLTFDSRVVLVYEMRLDELNGEGRFTYTTASNDDQLVLSQEG